MNDTVIKVIAILIVIIGLLGLWYFFRKLEQRNNVLTVDETTLKWKELKCVNCGNLMENGYSFAGRGINWIPKNEKKPGIFSSVGSVLENTISLRIPPPINMAWYCKNCKIVVIDNSKMLKINNA
jgi:hypothetical protein